MRVKSPLPLAGEGWVRAGKPRQETAVATRRDGAAQQPQPPGCRPNGLAAPLAAPLAAAPADPLAAAFVVPAPSAGAVNVRGALPPQSGQGQGSAKAAMGRDSVNGPQAAQA